MKTGRRCQWEVDVRRRSSVLKQGLEDLDHIFRMPNQGQFAAVWSFFVSFQRFATNEVMIKFRQMAVTYVPWVA